MEANDDWPMTLRWFVNELTMRKGSEDRVGTSSAIIESKLWATSIASRSRRLPEVRESCVGSATRKRSPLRSRSMAASSVSSERQKANRR